MAEEKASNPEELAIATKENQAVLRIRLAVAAFLLLCTVGTALIVYIVISTNETTVYERDLYEFASKTLVSLGSSMDHSISALDSFVVSAVSYAENTNQTWPFVFVPNIGAKLSRVRATNKAAIVAMIPVVKEEERTEWNEFSLHYGPIWVEDNLRIQQNDPRFQGNQLEEYDIAPIWNAYNNVEDYSIHYPYWQAYPTASSMHFPFNYDLAGSLYSAEVIKNGAFRITDIVNHPDFERDSYIAYLSEFVGNESRLEEPVSQVFYPIFTDAADDAMASRVARNESDMVGILWSTYFWRTQFTEILPSGTKPLVLVVWNTCGRGFTYEIEGPEANFVGYGDHHDHKYDHLVVDSTLLDVISGDSVYSGLPVAVGEDECSYSFQIYPSEEFESEYKTSRPWIYMIVTVAIFLFTSVVFGAYDFLVERRQTKVMSTAKKSSAIVSSLFPSNVRDRLYEFDKEKQERAVYHIPGFRNPRLHESSDTSIQRDDSPPIADLFPNATVMFADLAGFTKWSSTREPSQVFTLLENLYGKFDSCAEASSVFKVETIGDCYLAVAGLPEPRPDHAVAMVKFAHQCNTLTRDLMTQLSMTLGPDTEFLCMRFGLNSGPVTAGVLRGQKSRFQLFGDTVNTAARMESTGKTACIHASQATADELIRFGKTHWLQPREDTVEAKGKGRLQTYWIVLNEVAPSSTDIDVCQDEGKSSTDETDLEAP
eukprot:Nitzschia sp. Nitz4//scaffold67_size101165//98871//101089//NITZ4_004548-RA/size101165-augustus-gene-0.19-mRNA-1//1//CDS//3329556531//2435//frame0